MRLSLIELQSRINPTSVSTAAGFSITFSDGDSFYIDNGSVSFSSSGNPSQTAINPIALAEIINLSPHQIDKIRQRMLEINNKLLGPDGNNGLFNKVTKLKDQLDSITQDIANVKQQLLVNNSQALQDRFALLLSKKEALLIEYTRTVNEINALINEFNNLADLLNWSGDYHTIIPRIGSYLDFDLNYYNQGYNILYV